MLGACTRMIVNSWKIVRKVRTNNEAHRSLVGPDPKREFRPSDQDRLGLGGDDGVGDVERDDGHPAVPPLVVAACR